MPVHRLRAGSKLRQASEAVVLVVAVDSDAETGLVTRAREVGSGVLVAPCLVLTARHVLGDGPPAPGQRREVQVIARSTAAQGSGGAVTTLPATVATLGGGAQGWLRRGLLDDWALLRIDRQPRWMKPVPLDDNDWRRLDGQTPAAVVGFVADHFDEGDPVAWADTDCAVVERLPIGVVATSCFATSGNSGGPVLVQRGGGEWRVGGIVTRAQAPDAEGRVRAGENFAIPADAFLRRTIAAARRDGAC